MVAYEVWDHMIFFPKVGWSWIASPFPLTAGTNKPIDMVGKELKKCTPVHPGTYVYVLLAIVKSKLKVGE
jgi:hypothetical protein